MVSFLDYSKNQSRFSVGMLFDPHPWVSHSPFLVFTALAMPSLTIGIVLVRIVTTVSRENIKPLQFAIPLLDNIRNLPPCTAA